jgi:uncharacterized protein (TIGR02147 family)
MKLTPFYFTSPAEYLQSVLNEKQQKNPKFSLRQFSKQLGFSSPATLSRVLQSKRRISLKLVQGIASKLQLGEAETEHLAFLAFFDGVRNKKKPVAGSPLDFSHPKWTPLASDQFHHLRDWYSITILLMTSLRDFRADPKWISEKLKGRATPEECQEGIDRLVRLGFLQVSNDGSLKRTSLDSIDISFDHSTQAIRDYYKHILLISLSKLKLEPVEKRRMDVMTFSLKKEDLPLVQTIIRDAHQKIGNLSRESAADDVYIFSSQLLQMTE